MMLSVGGGPSAAFDGGLGSDFLTHYQFHRRFLSKPYQSEAAEQFGALARELCAQESLPYVAWCELAVVRCSQSMGHPAGEAAELGETAHLWLQQEREVRLRQGPRLVLSEHLPAVVVF